MRIADETARVLIDLPLLQAARLQEPHFQRTMERGDFDPFPDGSHATGDIQRRGAIATNSGIAETQLAGAPLTSFDGALPDHIQEALQSGLHNDDKGLQDFLAIFDRRLMALEIRARQAAVLVATQDATGRQAASILSRLLQLVKRAPDDTRHLELLFPLLSRTRTLEGVRDMLHWWTGRDVDVTAQFDTYRRIDRDSLTPLSARPGRAAALGRGALLGRFGRTPMGHVSVKISCRDRADLDALIADTPALDDLRSVTGQYLRDPVPVTFYATIARKNLRPPCLSARRDRADRLGAYNLLQPAHVPEACADIKITQLSA
ncbi:MAG: type VI secretion system baseplate subunit TssG [Pseudomonadota bacterium]